MRVEKVIAIIILLSAVGATDLNAQTATISGQVKNAEDLPVDKAIVQVGNKFDITDVDGKFRIKDVPQGQQPMQIKKDEQVLKETVIDVNESNVNKDEKLPSK